VPESTPSTLIRELLALGVRLQLLPEGRLSVTAPGDVLTDALKKSIALHKGALIELLARTRDEAGTPTIRPRDPASPTRASYGQERLWIIGQSQAGGAEYSISLGLSFTGALRQDALQAALSAIVARHEVLRSTFRHEDCGLCLDIEVASQVVLPLEDLSHETEGAVERAEERLVALPFNLAEGPLYRCRLLRLGPDRHVLLVVVHHIHFDHWSRSLFAKELMSLYHAQCEGTPPQLPALPFQYADYAAWQRERLEGNHLDSQLAWWRTQLQGAPELLDLPTDRPRPALRSHRGANVEFEVDAPTVAKLRTLAREQGATLFMVLQAAFAVLLHRYSGQDDLCVGTPIAGRNHAELEGLIGFFVNTLVLRTRVNPSESFLSLLRQAKQTALGAYANQDLPFEKLVEDLNPRRSTSYSALFQTMFILQNTPRQPLAMRGLEVEVVQGNRGTAKFDLTCSLAEVGERLHGNLEYATNLFDEATVRRMARHYEVLLEGICADATQKVCDLPLLTPQEKQQILVEWNDTAAEYPHELAIHQLFEQQVRRTPEAVALGWEGGQLSYQSLNARANQVAHRLRAMGVGPEVLVGICMERSPEMVVGLLATLKAGGAYVPIEPGDPQERIAFTLQDAAPKLLLTHRPVLDLLPSDRGPILCLDDWEGEFAGQPSHDAGNLTQPDNLAYVIYTSGSTGRPKGAANTHQAVVNRLHWMQREYQLGAADRVLQKTPFAFDVSVWEFFWTLLQGAGLVLARPHGHKDAHYLMALIRQQQVTTLHFVPSMLEVFVAQLGEEQPMPSLRRVICSGEALPASLQTRFFAATGGSVELHNLYGPTEAAIDVTHWQCRDDGTEVVPIGRPIANVQIYILDGQGGPVPVGVAGELHIGGAGLARGYLNRPELTAEKFVANPFGPAGSRLYRTGDRARYRSDGAIEYLGRLDHQVKLRGLRIELGEIEFVLQQHASVAQAVVMLREDEPGHQRLVAYFVGTASVQELRETLKRQLPEHMVPSTFMLLEALPLTFNGKVDRKALPAPDGQAHPARKYVAPQTPAQQTMARLWAEVLRLERVGLHDNFFELGGHSLLAVELIANMRREGLETDARSLFMEPTVEGLARILEAAQALHPSIPANLLRPDVQTITPDMLPLIRLSQAEIDAVVRAVPGGVANIQDIYPLTPLQEGILFHHRMQELGDPYLLQALYSFSSREQLGRVLEGLQFVVDRHDVLRTAVLWEELSQPVQVVWRRATIAVEEVAFDAGQDVQAELRERFGAQRFRLDVRRAPMIRAVAALDGQRWLLLLLCHHLIEDNTSLRFARAEVARYLQRTAQSESEPVPFRNFVARALAGGSQEAHADWFRALLGDVDAPTVPYGLRDLRGDGSAVREHKEWLDAGLGERVRTQARQAGVSSASLFHLAWAMVVARSAARDDVVFGTVLFGRMFGEQGIERSLGLFINTLPVRVRIDERPARRAVQEMHSQIAALLQHEHASLALAQRCSALPPGTGLFTCLLNYRHRPREVAQQAPLPDWDIQLLHSEERTNFPLKLAVDDDTDAFRLGVQVAGEVKPADVCHAMVMALTSLVGALEEDGAAGIASLEVVTEAQKARALADWQRPIEAPHETLHAQFEVRAREQPDAVALVFEDMRLTYGQLDAEANRLARHLRKQGVGPEQRVGIFMERSLGMVTAVLAVLKAGGAYVPLDPSHPPSRIAYLLEDAAPALLLTQHRLASRLPDSSMRRLCLDSDRTAFAGESPSTLEPLAGPAHAAYLSYTSGSTGRPKGVLAEHRGVANYLRYIGTVHAVSSTDCVLQIPPLSFDASVRDIFGALSWGATLHLLAQDDARSAAHIRAALRRHGVTAILSITPSLLEQVAEAEANALPALRTVLVSGEVLTPAVLRRVLARMGRHVQVTNQYGPTECTMTSTYFRATEHAEVCIGRPIRNVRTCILDARLRLVPAGAVGELHIGGAGVARGYPNLPELTAQRFVADPFGQPGDRLYKTGDLARCLPDGNLDWCGRVDDQIKLRGVRIEPAEIECLLQQAGAARAHVMLRDERLVAYLVAGERGPLDVRQLRSRLAAMLPDAMVPADYVELSQLPLTPNGKIDRQALPAPAGAHLASAEYVEPVTDLQRMLARIWATVLKVERVGIHDNFFALGGHSLLAGRVAAAASAALGREVPLRALFEYDSLEALARHIESTEGAPSRGAEPIRVVSRAQALPLSHAQYRLWFLDQYETGQASYNVPLALRLHGDGVDAASIAAVFRQLGARHEVLRTVFEVRDGEPRQAIRASLDLNVEFEDLSQWDAVARDERAAHLAAREAAMPFDLARGPLVRLGLLRLGPREHVLLVTLHHIICDAWSLGILVKEAAVVHAGLCSGTTPVLEPLAIQYADYAAWQRERLQGAHLQGQLAYWRRQLEGVTPLLDLPTDRPRPAVLTHRGGSVGFRLSLELSARLKRLARAEGATPFMVLQAAFTLLLHRYSGQDDISVGTPVAGRNSAQLEGVVGFFVNMLVLRLTIDPQECFRRLLARARQTALDAFANQDVPFELLVEELAPRRSAAYTPLFQVMFGLQNAPMEALEIEGLRFEALRTHTSGAKFDLSCILAERGDAIAGTLEYNAALFDEASATVFCESYAELLGLVAQDPDSLLGTIGQQPNVVLPALPEPEDVDAARLSFHQERIWFIDAFETGNLYEANPTYHNIPVVLALPFACDPGAVAGALEVLAARHPVLRTRMYADNGQPRKRFAETPIALSVRDIGCTDPLAVARNEALQPFAMDGGALARSLLLTTAAGHDVLVFVAHHAIADRASMRIVARELSELLAAQRESRPPRLPEVQGSSDQHAQWQRTLLQRHGSRYFTYWRRQLRAPLPALELPLRCPRPAVHTFTGEQHQFSFDADVRGLASRHGVSAFDVLAAVFAALLHRYTGQEELVFGTSWHGRGQPQLRDTVGALANLLVLRARVTGGDSFDGLAGRIAQLREAALAHAQMQFDQLVIKLHPEKDMSRTALFDVLFEVEDDLQALPAGIRCADLNMGYGKYDLHLHVVLDGSAVAGSLSYNRDILDEALVRRMIRHLQVLVAAMVRDAAQAVADPVLLSADEEHEQLEPAETLPEPRTETRAVHRIFEDVAAGQPDAVALTFAERNLSYAQLNLEANRVAHALLAAGMLPQDRVALFLPPGPELLAAILGCLKAGGCYVPLDPEHPQERLAFILQDSGCRLVVGASGLAHNAAFAGLHRVGVDAVGDVSDTNPALAADPGQAMYVIYTSGSTGRPKGTVIEHRSVAQLVIGNNACFGFGPSDRWCLFHSCTFDFSVWEIFGALLSGGRLVVVPVEVRRDPRAFLRLLHGQRVTVLNQTPTAFYNLQRELQEFDGIDLASLRHVIFGGEALNPARLTPFIERVPQARLVNMYGITETCVHVTFKEIVAGDVARGASNIGVPLPTMRAYLMDDRQRLVPKGVTGEIHVGGSGVCREYLNRPELNAARFVANPYRPAERLYRSGDLARLTEDGELIYVGRRDAQVKVRGHRIETGEVEAALVVLPEVADVCVALGPGDAGLVAWVVPKDSRAVPPDFAGSLRFAARQFLPEYMVPGRFVVADSLPLNANGKIDLARLPAATDAVDAGAYVAPAGEIEETLAAIWASVLGVERVGAHDNFFSLGGHSLLATQVMSRVRKAWQLELPLRCLFESPTISLLALRIAQEELAHETVEL